MCVINIDISAFLSDNSVNWCYWHLAVEITESKNHQKMAVKPHGIHTFLISSQALSTLLHTMGEVYCSKFGHVSIILTSRHTTLSTVT